MSGPSKQPHNAGQTMIVQQISPMQVSDMDWGQITITENWGRLFIRWNGQEVIALMGHYPKLVEAIQHFIEPAARTPDLAQIRAYAIREAASVAYCICAETQHVSLGQKVENAIFALLATPLSPIAVDGSPAPDAGMKGQDQ